MSPRQIISCTLSARDIGQDSFQSLEIAVDIGENGEFHEIAYHELPATRRNRQPCVRSS